MKKLCLSLLIVLALSSRSLAVDSTPPSFADLVEKLLPAVVNISTTQMVKPSDVASMTGGQGTPATPQTPNGAVPTPNGNKPLKATSLGSGFIISPTGLIVTNNHVIGTGTDITVTLHDDTKLKAKLVGHDTTVDVAVLKVEAGKQLPFLKFGNSDVMRVGDWVLAIGNPYGLGGTVTAGIISAKARDINVGPYDDFLQTDAAINRGNSGGPMFNLTGEVIGINTAIFTSQGGGNVGIGFATPSSLAKPVIDQIVKYGRAKRAWLGVKIQTVSDEIAASLGLKTAGGALVLQTIPNSPAGKAGIMEGDVITKFNGQQVAAMRKLPRIVAETELNSEVPVEIFRKGKSKIVKVTLTEMTAEQEKAENALQEGLAGKANTISGKVILGMKIAEITDSIKQKYKLSQSKGLLVVDSAADSNAYENGIRGGSVITKANEKPVAKISDLTDQIAAVKKQGRNAILLLIESASGSEERFVAVSVK